MSDHDTPGNDMRDSAANAFVNTLGDEPEPTRVLNVPTIAPAASSASPDATGALASGSSADTPLEGSDAEAYDALKRKRAERRHKKLVRRGIAAGVVVGVLALGGVAVALLNQPAEQGMSTVTDMALTGTFRKQVDASGTLQPLSSTIVTPEITGQIQEVNVTAGQTVNEGDVLFTIKNDELDRAVAQAERELKVAKQNLANAKQARTLAAQDEALAGMGGTDTEAAVLQASSEVDAAQDAYDLAVAKAALRTVKAPCAGSIVALNAQPGADLAELASGGSSSGPLIQIADLSKMKVTVQVSEEDIASVAVDQTADITFPAFEGLTLTGRVTGIASVASTDGGTPSYDGSSSPTFAVDILIDTPDARLKPGMTAEVALITQQLDNVVMVPVNALQTDDGTSHYVNVLTDPESEETERRDVTVVAQNDDYAVIGKPEGAAAEENPDMATAPVSDGEALVVAGGMGTGAMDGAEGVDMASSGGSAVV